MAHELPALPYAYDALEPYLDTQTVEIHHDKHHATYCANLNKALAGTDLEHADIWEVFAHLDTVPENIRTAVRNHGGGYANHNLFWECMGPGCGGTPPTELLNAIRESFGSFEAFKEKFSNLAISQFGSGWAWLGVSSDGRLCACSTPNQDNPAMKGIVECTATPILTLDVWEHAYYLKYQNRRAEWVQNWWNLVNWDAVSQKYLLARK